MDTLIGNFLVGKGYFSRLNSRAGSSMTSALKTAEGGANAALTAKRRRFISD
jgi:hypothetical protein